MEKQKLFKQMHDSILNGDKKQSADMARQSISMGVSPTEAIEEGYTPAIKEAGDLWEEGEYFLPELVMAADAMKAAMEVLKPELEKRSEKAPSAGKIVLGTIEGDIHDIGKSLIGALLSASGYQVFDLGVDVPAERFVEEAEGRNADLIGISALLTTTMSGQKKVIDELVRLNVRNKYKVIVGGAPVNDEWARTIGADAAPAGALDTVRTVRKLIKL
ncbi:MAG: B12-binding domain-containing protein [Vulcanimicrobiota bacterium]